MREVPVERGEKHHQNDTRQNVFLSSFHVVIPINLTHPHAHSGYVKI